VSTQASGAGSACGRCDTPLADTQRWCLSCGLEARASLASPRHWRATGSLAGIIGLCALAAIVFALGGSSSSPAAPGIAHAAGATSATGATTP
jgi:hypothetical protein